MKPPAATLRQPWARRVRATLLVVLCALNLAAGAQTPRTPSSPPSAPVAAPDPALAYRFSEPGTPVKANFGPHVLTPAERDFLKNLPELRVGLAKPGFRPYEVIGDNRVVSGVHPDMLANLTRAFGIRIKPLVFEQWSDVLDALTRREVDLLMSLTVTPARSEYLEFTLGVSPMVSGIFSRPGQAEPDAAPRFVVVPSKAATDHVRRHFPQARLLEVADESAALLALAELRADYYLSDLLPTLDRLQRMKLEGVEVQRTVEYGTGHYHFAVRKGLAPLARILNKAIAANQDQPSSAWNALLAALPASIMPSRPVALEPRLLPALIDKPVWRIGAVKGLSLLNEIDDRGLHSGIAADYSEAVARQLGVALQVEAFPDVAAMLDALRAGRIDVVPFATRTEQRARDFGFSKAYVEMPYTLIARSDSPLYWDLNSLRGKRLALAQQHPLRELLARRYPDVRIVDVPGGQGAMDAVAEGRADAAVEVKFFANLRIQRDNDGLLRTVAVVDELPATFHFATSPAARALAPVIDEALSAIPEAERERMLRRWVAQDLHPEFPWRRWRPVIAMALLSLLTIAGLTAWWMLRMRREVQLRRGWQELLHDVAATVPSVSFRYRLGPDGQLKDTYISPNAMAFFGFQPPPNQTLLQSVSTRLSAEDRQALRDQERRSMNSGERFKVTVRYQGEGQSPRWIHAEAVRSSDEAGLTLWTGYVVDVSTERELQQQLTREAEARHLLLASASHELRAPTHNLALALQSIDHDQLDPTTRGTLRIAERSAATLTQLLSDVLDAARVNGASLRLRPVSFDLKALLDEVGQAWAVVARAKGLNYEHVVDAEVPRSLVHDPLRLRQVLTNLLSNACKYTAKGAVALVVSRTTDQLVFAVHDSGRGIESSDIERLFKPYVTLGAEAVPDAEGGSSGLGLVVCRRIAALAGGRIDVSSRIGEGSIFSLVIPLQLPVVEHATEPVPPVPQPALAVDTDAVASVLVCDDDPVTRMLTAQILRMRGYQVHEAGDVASAFSLWSERRPQALITDLNMPGESGYELIRQVRRSEQGGLTRCRVIVCSGDAPVEGAQPQADYDSFVVKPLQEGLLVRALAQGGVVTRRVRV